MFSEVFMVMRHASQTIEKRVGFNPSLLLWVFHNFWSPNIQLSFSALNHIIETQDLQGPKKKVRLRSHGFFSDFTLLQKVAEKIQLQPALKNPGVLEDHNSPPQHKLLQNHQPEQVTI